MRILKIMLIALVLCVVSALSMSCGSESDSAAVTEEQMVAVQRGDLTIDITAVGNLAFAYEEKLTFEVGGTVGVGWYWPTLWILSCLECLTSQSY